MNFINMNLIPLLLLDGIAEDVPTIDTSAVDKIFEWIQHILNTEVIKIGGVTLTVGLLLIALIKFFFPKNKQVAELEIQNRQLKAENNQLKDTNEELQSRVSTLETKVDVIIEYNPNKRVRDSRNYIADRKPMYARYQDNNLEHRRNNKKHKVRVKVKKAVTDVVDNVIDKVESEVMNNGI